MKRHRAGRLLRMSRDQRFDDRQVFVGFLGEPVKIVAGFFLLPRDIAEDAKEDFEPADFPGEKAITARGRDQVVQPIVDRPCAVNEGGRMKAEGRSCIFFILHPSAFILQDFQVLRECVEIGKRNPAGGAPDGFALEHASHLANLADFFRAYSANDSAAVRQ